MVLLYAWGSELRPSHQPGHRRGLVGCAAVQLDDEQRVEVELGQAERVRERVIGQERRWAAAVLPAGLARLGWVEILPGRAKLVRLGWLGRPSWTGSLFFFVPFLFLFINICNNFRGV